MPQIIAIDGPASSGKSTLAKKISNYYKSPVLNSGKLYRAISLEIKDKNIELNDKVSIIKICKSLNKLNLDSKKLFSSEIDKISSLISSKKYLRNELRSFQRNFPNKYARGKKFAIIEGRDIGTEIFPEAKFKVFIWADARIRAKRRYEQIIKKGEKAGLERIYKEIIARDVRDLNRVTAPLKPAVNSVLLDTSYLDIEQSLNVLKKILERNKI